MHQLTGLDEVVRRILIVMMPKCFSLDNMSVRFRETESKAVLRCFQYCYKQVSYDINIKVARYLLDSHQANST